MSKSQIKTFFGVAIPPFKEPNYGSGGITLRFILTGKTPSKKNNTMSVAVRKIARDWAKKQEKSGKNPSWKDVHRAISLCTSKVRPNAEYKEWVERMKPVLQDQAAYYSGKFFDKGLVFPLKKATLSLRFYFKDRYVQDTVNKQQSVQDLLIEAGIIANDDYKSLNPIHSASAEYYEEVVKDIAYITLYTKL